MAELLDRLEANGRFALLKLATGGLRVGVSARLAKTALAQAFGLDVEAVEEVWHGISPPYQPLFDWAEGRADQPTAGNPPVFRPFLDRKSVVSGKSGSVRVDLGCCRIIK